MYPSYKDPTYGVFVRNFYEYITNRNGTDNTYLIAIKGRAKSAWRKIMDYFVFYVRIIFSTLLNKYDLIYVHTVTFPTPPLRIVSAIKNLPLAFNVHGSDWLTHSSAAMKLKRMAFPLLSNCKFIVAPSSVFKEVIMQELPNMDANRIYVSYSGGLNSDLFKPAKVEQTGEIILGFVSHIIEKKGWRLFVDAIYRLKNKGYAVKGIMAGAGEQSQKLLAYISEYGLECCIRYLGAVNQDNLPTLYNQMTLFVFPTLFYESLGLVGIEAMACGVPVIGSNYGGLKEYIRNGENGFLFEPGDVDDMCSKIESYINLNDEERNRMQIEALNTSKRFDKKVVMDNLFSVIYDTNHNDRY